MQKEIQLTDKTLLVVGLPETTKHVGMMCDNLRVEFVRKDGSTWDYNWGKYVGWQLLGIFPELTEEMASRFMPKAMGQHYINHNSKQIYDRWCKTAKESFQSLMERENITGYDKYAILIKSK